MRVIILELRSWSSLPPVGRSGLKTMLRRSGDRYGMRCAATHPPQMMSRELSSGTAKPHAVNSAQHENRQRFTIAHEIGHFFLHKRARRHFDEDFRIDYRNSISAEATERDEIEANRCAAALLMPETFLRKGLLRIEADESEADYVIQTLSIRYKVSRRAAELRLLNLGLISPIR